MMQKITIKYCYLVLLIPLFMSAIGNCYAELDAAKPELTSPNSVTQPLDFDSLSAAQKNILMPMREKWSQLPAMQQQRLIKGANRWTNMSKAEQDKARSKMQRWSSMSPKKRERMLKRLQRYQAMDQKDRRRLRQTFRKFRRLPESRREELRERWRNSGPAERRQIRREVISDDNSNTQGPSRTPDE